MTQQAVERIVALFESFAASDVARLGDFYAPDARFKDPFNEVQGLAAVQRVYSHMFETLEDPRFRITRRMSDAGECWLVWEFHFRFRSTRRGRAQLIHGASHLVLTPDGRIQVHRDYWDAAEELYAKLPVIGALMRWLQRRIAVAG